MVQTKPVVVFLLYFLCDIEEHMSISMNRSVKLDIKFPFLYKP